MSRDTRSTDDQIEFLPPNDAAFGMADIADFAGFDGVDENVFDDDGPRSKWLPALASVVILGLVGIGVVAAAPWDGSSSTAPTTSTTPTTVAQATTTEPPLDVVGSGPPGFLIDEPGEFQLAGAWSVGPDFPSPVARSDDWFDLWTTPDATRTSGRWLAVTTLRGRGEYYETRPSGTRIAAGLDVGVLDSSSDGVVRLMFTANDGTRFEIGGFGFTLPDLLTMADQIGADEEGLSIEYGAIVDGALAGLTPAVSTAVPNGGLEPFILLSVPEASSYYINRDFTGTVEVKLSQSADVDAAVYDFLMPQMTNLTLADQTALDALRRDGVPVQVRADPDSSTLLVASWMTARGAVTVSANNIDVSTLIDLLPSLRLADDVEWAELIDRSNHGLLDIEFPEESSPMEPTVIGRQAAGSDTPFWIVQMAANPAAISVQSDQTGWYDLVGDISATPSVRQFAAASITFLVATAEWPNPARVARVTVEGQPPVDLPMVQVGNSTVYAAGYAFTEVAGATVEFFDEAGNPVAG